MFNRCEEKTQRKKSRAVVSAGICSENLHGYGLESASLIVVVTIDMPAGHLLFAHDPGPF